MKKKSPEESELLEDFTFLNVIVCPFDDDLNEVCPVEKKGSVSLIIKIIQGDQDHFLAKEMAIT